MKVPIIMLSCFLHHSNGKSGLSKRDSDFNQSAIVGGHPASIHSFPSLVHMRITYTGGSRYCSGTLLSKKFILTSAHCLTKKPIVIYINVGSTTIYGGVIYRSNFNVPHPQYETGKAEFDIGVVKTVDEMEFDNVTSKVGTLVEQDHKINIGAVIKVPGWGKLKDGGNSISYALRSVNVFVVDAGLCQSSYRGKYPITDRVFCAGNPQIGGMGPCDGDSGSPAIDSDGKQVGIVAAGFGCGRAAFPEIYTNVGYFRNWIRSVAGV